ncbi:MAG: c-type cytochrome [Acidobacteriota bacterium]
MGRFLLGIIVGIVLIPLVVLGWLKFGHPPVAVADPPLPMERQITHIALHGRINSEMIHTPPIQPTDDNLLAGAQIYHDQCAVCHGSQGKPSPLGPHLFPHAPQLWEKHHNGNVVGVSDDPPGATYWKVANGIRLTGMPAFNRILNDDQMWQVSLLLANADKPLSPAALSIVRDEPPPAPVAAAPAKMKRKR